MNRRNPPDLSGTMPGIRPWGRDGPQRLITGNTKRPVTNHWYGRATAPAGGAFSGSNQRRLVERHHRAIRRALIATREAGGQGAWREKRGIPHIDRHPGRHVAARTMVVFVIVLIGRAILGVLGQGGFAFSGCLAAFDTVLLRLTAAELSSGRTDAETCEQADQQQGAEPMKHRPEPSTQSPTWQAKARSAHGCHQNDSSLRLSLDAF